MVITFGDSYASGTGSHRYGNDYDEKFGARVTLDGESYIFTESDNEECWRELDTTPGARYANLSSVNKESTMYACKGATLPYVRRQIEYANAKHTDYSSKQWPNSVVVMTGGGNDIVNDDGDNWPDIITRCITEFNPFRGCHQNSNNQPSNWEFISESLFELYKFVGTGFANAQIRVLGYPRFMQPTPGCGNVGGISVAEAEWLDEQVDRLNSEISSAVNRTVSYFRDVENVSVDIRFVNVESYINKGACTTGDEAQIRNLDLSWRKVISPASFHPNLNGHDACYQALLDSF